MCNEVKNAMNDVMSLGEKKRYPFVVAVHWFAYNSAGEVLLLRRFNTGYMDGSYSVPAGHVDGEETARVAMLREIQEEVGVELPQDDLQFAHVMHRTQESEPYERIDFFFASYGMNAEVTNCEPAKCDELLWVNPEQPPQNMVEYVAKALSYVTQNEFYSEHAEA